jgi:fermentation-respiration switch protein FrsA (DUF1100 family)
MRTRLALRAITIAGATTLTLMVGGAALASSNSVPDDQPLPPYTISNPTMAPIMANGALTTVFQGVHGHAAYKVEVPAQWNGDLVVWAHGFRGQGTVLTVDAPSFNLRQKFVNEGYAWAASSYTDNGYDVAAGVVSSKDIAEFFPDLTGAKPHSTFIAGVSMGGHVIGRSVEQYPHFYDGALPMCGVLGDQTLFDFFLDFNVVGQDLAGVPAFPFPADYATDIPKIESALGIASLSPIGPDTTNDLGKQFRSIVINRSGGPRPGATSAFAFWKDFLFGLGVPSNAGNTLAENPGQLSQNLDTNYQPNTPVDVNATVVRVAAANHSARQNASLSQVPKILGHPEIPVMTLHGLGDMFVPFSMEQAYRQDIDQTNRGDLVVQRAIRSVNHCEFSATEAGTAWDDLVSWVHTGNRPAGDDVLNPQVVADPNFGCQFSDKAAYAAGTGTRRLFAACP